MRHVTVSSVSSAECPRNGDRTRDPHPRRLYRRHSARALRFVRRRVSPSSRTRVVTHTRTLSTTIETTTIETTTTTANAGVFTNDDGAREAAFAVDDGQ